MEEEKLEHLKKLIGEASQLRELMKQPGMKLLRHKLAERRIEIRKKWWMVGPEEAEHMRHEARNVDSFFDLIKMILLKGDQAALQLKALNPPSEQSE